MVAQVEVVIEIILRAQFSTRGWGDGEVETGKRGDALGKMLISNPQSAIGNLPNGPCIVSSKSVMTNTRNAATVRGSSLDISKRDLAQLSAEVNKLVLDYFADVAERPLFPRTSGGDTIAKVGAVLAAEGESLEKLLADCRTILEGSRHNGHPRFFGYVASPATPIGAYGDLIASALNPNVTSWRSGPAATEIERTVVRWLGTLIGYSDDAHGLLTSGGSLANTTDRKSVV